jgi:hypothetical protein
LSLPQISKRENCFRVVNRNFTYSDITVHGTALLDYDFYNSQVIFNNASSVGLDNTRNIVQIYYNQYFDLDGIERKISLTLSSM